jgi:hypothetical protein
VLLSNQIIGNSYNHLSRFTIPVGRYHPLISSVIPTPSYFYCHDSSTTTSMLEQHRTPRVSLPISSQQQVSDVDYYESRPSSSSRHIPALLVPEDSVHVHRHFVDTESKAIEKSRQMTCGMDKKREIPLNLSSRVGGACPADVLCSSSKYVGTGTGKFKGTCSDAHYSNKFEVHAPLVDDVIVSKGRKVPIETTVMSLSTTNSNNEESTRIRPYQDGNWMERYTELVEFHRQHGHCLVPNSYKENPSLAEWVKRQRYQYKLKTLGERNSMTQERIMKLEKLGFVWNSHDQLWEERLNDLKLYFEINGDCNVPNRYAPDPSLAAWVKVRRKERIGTTIRTMSSLQDIVVRCAGLESMMEPQYITRDKFLLIVREVIECSQTTVHL